MVRVIISYLVTRPSFICARRYPFRRTEVQSSEHLRSHAMRVCRLLISSTRTVTTCRNVSVVRLLADWTALTEFRWRQPLILRLPWPSPRRGHHVNCWPARSRLGEQKLARRLRQLWRLSQVSICRANVCF